MRVKGKPVLLPMQKHTHRYRLLFDFVWHSNINIYFYELQQFYVKNSKYFYFYSHHLKYIKEFGRRKKK